jgi:hypothetical protein
VSDEVVIVMTDVTGRDTQSTVIAGLDPAIHSLRMDGRIKSGHDS